MPQLQYCGRLKYKGGQAVPKYPVLWVSGDSNGNYNRMINRLSLNGLAFEGGKVPSIAAGPGSVRELVLNVQAELGEEADPDFKLDKPLSYTALMKKLESLGLVQPIPQIKPNKSGVESQVTASHRAKVKEQVRVEDRNNLAPPFPQDIQNTAPGSSVSTTAQMPPPGPPSPQLASNVPPSPGHLVPVTSSPCDGGLVDPQAIVPGPKQIGSVQHAPGTGNHESSSVHDEAIQILTQQRSDAIDENKRLRELINIDRSKIAQLEYRISADSSNLASTVSEKVKELLNVALDNLRLDISSQMGIELRSEIERLNRDLVATLQPIHEIKKVVETSQHKIADNAEHLGELSATDRSVLDKCEELQKQMSLLKTQFSSLNALVVENLKSNWNNRPSLLTPPLSSAPRNAPPSRVFSACCYCGEHTHDKDHCSQKTNFCPRCLSRAHKVYECPDYKSRCDYCFDTLKRGDHSYGHLSVIHSETDHDRRKHITSFLGKDFFDEPQNVNSARNSFKRKLEF